MHPEERMKYIWAFAALVLTTITWGAVDESSLQLQLQPGQALKLELSSGDYRIEPGAGDKVVVISQNKQESRQAKPRFGIDTNAKEASVRVEGPKNYAALIQVPKNSNLRVRLSGGRLRVDGINGDKDIESNAGAVSIDVGRPDSYARVDASVDIGHIDAAPFQIAREGFEQSFSRQGPGNYRLHAHVGTGEIKLYSGAL
jgi:hypothetical protein